MRIEVAGGADHIGEIASLYDWLRADGDVFSAQLAPAENRSESHEEMAGGVMDVILVAAGSGGIGTLLVSSLRAWIITRRSDVRISITSTDGSLIEISATGPAADRIID